MRRFCLTTIALLTALAAPVFAAPPVDAVMHATGLFVRLQGSFAGSTYTVRRSDSAAGAFQAITTENTLCLGECAAIDYAAVPGRTLYYRFDVQQLGSSLVTYGPFAVLVPQTPLVMRATPNPFREWTSIDLSLPAEPDGSPAVATVRVLDFQGRTVRVLHHGSTTRTAIPLIWDGNDENGRRAAPGVYLVHAASASHHAVVRVALTR